MPDSVIEPGGARMRFLRTPEQQAGEILAGIAGYPAGSRFVSIPSGDGQDLRVHLVDAGPADAPVVVFLHGNPSWSYIWRHQIDAVVAAGYRAVAPDLVGMGLSDKPSEMTDYTVARHVEWTRSLLFDALDLPQVHFVLHDWGGIIGMRLAAENPGRVARMVISNTGLPWRDIAEPLPDVIEASGPFADFQTMARLTPRWEPWTMLPMLMVTAPGADVQQGYHAPYPDPSLTIGSRAFTQLLPTRPDNPMYPANHRAWQVLDAWTQPVLTIFSDRDRVAPDGWKPIVDRIPGAAGQPHVILEGGGHFLQEDVPEAYNAALLSWMGTPS
jgi:haloalkane dehalogenase